MSQLILQGKIVLASAIETSTNVWEFQFDFVDNEGVFLVTDIQPGDILVIDTSQYELGTFTRYIITSVIGTSGPTATVEVEYDATNNNLSPPDVGYSIGLDGVVTRPSTNYKLLNAPSTEAQLISDRFQAYLYNYNFNDIVDKITGGGGSTQVLTNATPTPTTLGGIPAGTTFADVPVETVLQDLLYPYQTPAFTAFSISGQSTGLEVGQSVAGGSRTFVWSTSNSSNVQANSVTIQNITGGTTTLVSSTSNDGTEAVSITSVTKTVASSHVWRILASNTKTQQFTRDFTVTWQWRRYHGESVLTTLSEPEIEALRVSQLSSSFAGTYAFQAGGYKWIAYPTSFGTATSFKDTATNLDVPFQPVVTIDLTNAHGATTQYNVHRTTNILGAAISILVA